MRLDLLRQWSSFTFLNFTQFLGALNDNIYKLVVVFFLINLLGEGNSHIILSTTSALFVLPFLLFSAGSGVLADRFSKSNIIVLTKLLEVITMGFGLFAFIFESVWATYFILFLLATQSAIFGPSKYGIVPELVPFDRITKANGLLTSFTFVAIILGSFLASFITDITNGDYIVASLFCLMVSIIGLITSFCIEYTPPSGAETEFGIRVLHEIYSSLKIAKEQPSLLMAIMGSSFFLFLGAFVQLNIIPFAEESLGLNTVQGGYLFLLTALGIGSGAMIAAKISGNTVELGLAPLAGFGVTVTCYFIDYFSTSLGAILPLVVIVGMFGGMYQVPMDSYIQVASPSHERGRIIAATNFLSFVGVLLASILIYLNKAVFGLSADKGFILVGNITLAFNLILTYVFFDYVARFLAMALARLHFRTSYEGTENLPDTPAIFVCSHTAWNDTLLMLGGQRRRMRFFIEHELDHSPWLKRLYHLLRIVYVPAIEPLEHNQMCHTVMRNALNKGFSVCIFTTNPNVQEEIDKLRQSENLNAFLDEKHFPVIPVTIEKGEKHKPHRFFMRQLNKIHVPAAVIFGSPVNV
ncbi:MAG: MFS transporter [Parachlamydiales bacterium]|jgi:acyl-[acyl-carrier-protein]-phospholipid O-acyltransferase/long-chain-fatty-acid--[acyl-carrier-protein] ligase